MFSKIATLGAAAALLILASFGAPSPASAALSPDHPWQAKIDPHLLAAPPSVPIEFLLVLAEQADLGPAALLPTKLQKTTYVYETLRELAERTQGSLVQALTASGSRFRPFWVANMIWVQADTALLQRLAQRADVTRIIPNPQVRFQEPSRSPWLPRAKTATTIEWNLIKIAAPELWQKGIRGQGVVVGGQDTGYQWNHPALIRQYRGWDGATADHDYNWHDAIHSGNGICGHDAPAPCDDSRHGTHTMGTMVGDDGVGNQIGMAPAARWIGCRNMNEGLGSPASYAECYQWFIAPTDLGDNHPDPAMAPDVINNSWGCTPTEGCTDPEILRLVVQNVRAAGILTVHSAGNEGPQCSTVQEPAGIYEESFSIGATDADDEIADFSSRGPVTVDGSQRLKPNVTAPGVNIRSSVPGGGYEGGWSGTSMAAPHVAGLVALLLSAQPALKGQVDTLETLIESTSTSLTTAQNCGGVAGHAIPNNTYGWGRVDALAAYLGLAPASIPTLSAWAQILLAMLLFVTAGGYWWRRSGRGQNFTEQP
ncbi:MAG: S8 family serine peptidase [Chromatiaceae bacterium]|nr:S8 family serine peptidase [Chromatiaceae bacterium]